MSALIERVELPLPPDLAWTPAEWAALGRSDRSRDMDQRWTFHAEACAFVMKRSGRPIFEGEAVQRADGSFAVVGLGCEGDPQTFVRRGFSSDSEVTELFVRAARGLVQGRSN